MNTRTIQTESGPRIVHTSIVFCSEWQATFDGYDGAEDAHDPIGHGATEQEAIDNLLEHELVLKDIFGR